MESIKFIELFEEKSQLKSWWRWWSWQCGMEEVVKEEVNNDDGDDEDGVDVD